MVRQAKAGTVPAPIILEADQGALGCGDAADLATADVGLLEGNFGSGLSYTYGVHSESPFLWAGSRGAPTPAGPFTYPTPSS